MLRIKAVIGFTVSYENPLCMAFFFGFCFEICDEVQ